VWDEVGTYLSEANGALVKI